MNSSALCEWPLLRKWTQIKVNHQSCHGDTQECTPGTLLQTKDYTLHHHFTFPTKWSLNVTLLKNWAQSDRFEHTFSKHSQPHILCWLLTDDRKKCPPPSGPHELGEEKNNKPQDFPDSPVNKNWPPNAADIGSVSGLEDSTCCRATKPVSHNYWARALEPVHYYNYWSLCTWSLCSATREATS